MGEWQKDLNGWRWKISVHRKRQMYSLSKQVVLHVSMDWGIKHQNVHSIGRTSVWRSTKVSAYLTHFCVKCNFAPWNNVKWGKPAYIHYNFAKKIILFQCCHESVIKTRLLTNTKLCANTLRFYILSYLTTDTQLSARTGFHNTTCLPKMSMRGIRLGFHQGRYILQYQFFSIYSGTTNKPTKLDGSCLNILIPFPHWLSASNRTVLIKLHSSTTNT